MDYFEYQSKKTQHQKKTEPRCNDTMARERGGEDVEDVRTQEHARRLRLRRMWTDKNS